MIFPKKLKTGSHIRVIAPSRSFKIISKECRDLAQKRLGEMGLTVSFSKNADEFDDFASSSVQSRLDDLHEAFQDPSVDGILTAIGGFNSNQILDKIDYELIKKNPKILCGFSDITALTNAITSKTGLVTYSGAHFSTFGMLKGIEYTTEYFKKCLMTENEIELKPSDTWSDDMWFLDQENRKFVDNKGYWILNEGKNKKVQGKLIGGNLCTIQLLFGTEFAPDIKDSILFIEDDEAVNPVNFDRDLQSFIHQPNFETVRAVVIGRFQNAAKIDKPTLEKIIKSKPALKDIPVIANANFGHTTPIFTFPLGGEAEINIGHSIKILKH